MSVEKLITENLELWTGAATQKSASGRGSSSKRELTGIRKLRELILELAVRGKLVPQDSSDEPAEQLLEALDQGKVVRGFGDCLISDSNLPAGWAIAPLTNFGSFAGGKTPSKAKAEYWEGDIPWVSPKDMSADEVLGAEDHVAQSAVDDGLALHPAGSILIVVRSGILRRKLPVAIARIDCTVNQDLKVLRLKAHAYGEYLRLMLLGFESFILENLTKTGVTVESVKFREFAAQPFPIPPIAEQHRIVQKVDELMALCDQLEQQTGDQIEAHERLVDTLLDTLTRAANATELAENWARVQQHFDTLFTTEHSIDRLKQTILQLAVMGRLVPHDPDDDSVPSILEGVASMRKDLRAKKKISPEKGIVDDRGLEAPKAPIPPNWKWCRLSDIATVVRGGSPRPAGDPKFYEGDIPFLKVADVTRAKGKFVEGYTATIKEAGLSKTRFIDVRTVLLSNSGATLGIPAICDFPATFNDGIAAFIYLADGVDDEFLHLYLRSKTQWFIEFASRGQGQPNLNTDIIRATWFPLPPLEEQRRIVARVDELMTMCDSLDMQFGEANQTLGQLASVVVEQVVQ
ncbi:MAG: type I restriction endonuclease subunit S [Salinisphaeraceae bacterium]|nr:type I restriction endonuclease subunit S [Salinisphaeraceae bacterium]